MRKIAVSIFGFLFLSGVSYAQGALAPMALRGKSAIVSWSEERAVKRRGAENLRQVRSSHTLQAYISSTGRVFNRYSATGPGGRTGASEQVAGSPDARRQARFEGRSLLVENRFKSGARRIAITFDERFASCTATVINGLAQGETKSIRTSVITKQEYELYSAKTGPATCEVRNGNVFE